MFCYLYSNVESNIGSPKPFSVHFKFLVCSLLYCWNNHWQIPSFDCKEKLPKHKLKKLTSLFDVLEKRLCPFSYFSKRDVSEIANVNVYKIWLLFLLPVMSLIFVIYVSDTRCLRETSCSTDLKIFFATY